ncbi:hypothetical protein [Thermoactinomyces sp. DSM 45891]|uniref:hypothetical protein n=1 Tax=Thermoactinomyces sp. DSM 45891 TaxID=1761907 RepID=UPI000930E401|nr:hypothetical protein [Thermoactinomyces sp. DSM 45891]
MVRKDRRTDPLIHLYLRQKEFYQQGDVYLGCIVQANEFLFDPQNRWNCPAAVLYTQDDYYYQHPEELAQLAHDLYSVKGETGYVENVQMFADMLANEFSKNVILKNYI